MRRKPTKEAKSTFWVTILGEPSGERDLWQRVDFWRTRLKDCETFPFLYGLEATWQLIDAGNDHAIDREERCADNPLAAFFYYIDTGFYPPPEILLALHDAFEVYKVSQGQISLEEVFFGPPRRKAGSYARRKATRFQRLFWGFRIEEMMRKGYSKAKASELISEEWRGAFSPETIARRAVLPRFGKLKRKK